MRILSIVALKLTKFGKRLSESQFLTQKLSFLHYYALTGP